VPWPSLGWLIRSGAAVKVLAGAASVAVVAGALPFAVPFIARTLRPAPPTRELVARSTHHRAHVAQRVAMRLAPTPVAVRAAHTRHHTAKAVRPAPVTYGGPAPQIPADDLATITAADTAQPSAGGTASAVDLPPVDSSTTSTPPDSQRQLDTSSPPHGHDPQGEGGGQSSAGGPGNSANSPN
jgi:hypothetical protein